MAMNRKPKPLKPSGPTKPFSSDSFKKPKPVVKVQPKTALTKSAVKNPSAPKPVGSGAKGSVKVVSKTEIAIKKGQAKGVNTGSKPAPKKLKKVSTTDKMIQKMQSMRGRGGMRGGGNMFGNRPGSANK